MATTDLDARLQKGLAHHQAGRVPKAESVYREILAVNPEHSGALHFLGVVVLQGGDAAAAAELIEQAVTLNPEDADALNNLGQAYEGLDRPDDAAAVYRRAIELASGFAAALNNLGNVLTGQDKAAEAVELYWRALKVAPDDPEILSNLGATLMKLGNALREDGRLDEAVNAVKRALAVDPGFVEAHYNLGVLMKAQGLPEKSVESYRRALAIDPNYLTAYVNLGGVLVDLGRLEEAEAAYLDAIAIDPDYAEAHHNLSLVLLLQGRLQEGWAAHEWRWRVKGGEKMQAFPQPLWEGQGVKDKTVLVWAEQGIGDEIMFAGMVPDLIDAGARIVLESDPRLVPLFGRSFAGVECVAKEDPPATLAGRRDVDFQTPAGNMARWLRSGPADFPHRRSYLAADAARRGALRKKYQQHGGPGDGLLVGIAWVSKSEKIGREKSMALTELSPLTGIPGVTLVDLQYGDTKAERDAFAKETGTPVLHDADIDQMADLDAFAAQVAALDLVVSVSNTTVHLAGALGVPTLVMLNTVPLSCWRITGDASDWYPSLRLFRQTGHGVWADVISRVLEALAEFAAAGERGPYGDGRS